MSLINQSAEKGILKTTIYDFEHENDELPAHSHEEGQSHITIVARGSLKAFGAWGPNGEQMERVVRAGAYLEWEPGQEHGLIALEPNTRIFNIIY